MNDQTNQVTQEAPNETGLLTDDQGKRSMMRLMSFMALIAGIWFAWMTLTDDNITTNEGVYITTTFLLAAFAPKALQKYVENSYPPKK
ncbi:hypothetical protein HQ531_02415 [bacterium]|nr:hypothetical protein [bacterium]